MRIKRFIKDINIIPLRKRVHETCAKGSWCRPWVNYFNLHLCLTYGIQFLDFPTPQDYYISNQCKSMLYYLSLLKNLESTTTYCIYIYGTHFHNQSPLKFISDPRIHIPPCSMYHLYIHTHTIVMCSCGSHTHKNSVYLSLIIIMSHEDVMCIEKTVLVKHYPNFYSLCLLNN